MPARPTGRDACATAACIHCGTGFKPTAHRPDFCCAGCQFVHDLIAKNGLGQFYDLEEGGVQPVKSLVFQKRDFGWLEELIASAGKAPVAALMLDVQGLSCIGCAWLIERLFARKPGALDIRVDPTLGRLDLRWTPGVFDALAFARELQSFGYLVGPLGKNEASPNRSLVIRLGLCGALTMNTMLFTLPGYLGMEPTFQYAALFERCTLILGTLSLLIGGSYFFARSWRSLRQRVLHIDLPISIGLLAAYAGSVFAWTRGAHGFLYFDFVSMFTFLMLVGRWLQLKAVERNRSQLLAAQGDPAPVRDLATGEKLPVAQLAAGAKFAIDPGQAVPVRSRLDSEAATLGLEWISGESEAATARRGRIVPAGASNCGQCPIALEALESWSDSLLSKLLRVTPATTTRNDALERFIRRYIMIVLIVAALGFTSWWLASGSLLAALQVLISVLVVSCPCASGVALPLCSDLAASRLRRVGVFIRESELWTKLERVRKIVFDKTGTLTLETISLRNPEALHALLANDRAVLLAMVHDNLHPVSGCLREQLLADGVVPGSSANVRETIGFGLEIEHRGAIYRLGRPEWAGSSSFVGRDGSPSRPSPSREAHLSASDAEKRAFGGEDGDVSAKRPYHGDCVFTRDGAVLARFAFGEEARADAAEELAALRERGCDVFILSGDRLAKVAAMADRLALPRERCLAELSPEQKAHWIAKTDARDTLYLGDGANDSLAFDAAWCTGTPAIDRGLLEQKAGFYFLGRGLSGVRALLDTAALRRRTAHRVVAFAIAYNTFAITLCLFGKMNPLLAAILMPASSLVSLAIVFAGLRQPRMT
jgi:P-type Cu2+ transporter